MGKQSSLFYDEMETPIGPMTILMSKKGLCRIDFGTMRNLSASLHAWSNQYFLSAEYIQDDSKADVVKQQLKEYFNEQRKIFTVDFHLNGTAFQQKVWKALFEEIPFGETKSYKDIAEKIHAPKAVRAVGGAVNKNPLSILVPCHRVIGSNGSLVGYNGGMDKKKHLLRLEKALVNLH